MDRRFRIIPVLDLKEGLVVRGIQGERDKYQPIKSILTSSAEFPEVLEAFYKYFGFGEYYIADLDALVSNGKKDQLSLVKSGINKCTFPASFMLDAGIRYPDDLIRVIQTGIEKVVIGTETLESLESLREMTKRFNPRRLVLSIDIMDSQVLSLSPEIAGLSPVELIRQVRKTRIQEFILLQLSRVGTGKGLNKQLITECVSVLHENGDSSRLMVGGGVSCYEDLKWLRDNGIEGALVASVLHEGNLNPEMVQSLIL